MTIGSDVVVGAGSVVTRDVPSGVVVVGVPARVHCDLATYREAVLARAVYLTSTDPDERRAAVLDHVRRRGAPGPGRVPG